MEKKADMIQIERELTGEYGNTALWKIRATFSGRKVGYCNCNIESGTSLLIADLLVKEKEFQSRLAWWRRILMRKADPVCFRGRGIGSALMAEVFAFAAEKQVSRIYGYVTQSDLEETSTLLDWYQGLGFAICDPDGQQEVPAVKMIEILTK